MSFDEGNDLGRDGLAFTCMMVEVDNDRGAVCQEVGVGGVTQFMFQGPGLGAYMGGTGEYVDGRGIKDGLLEVDLGARYGHVELVRVLQPGYVRVVCYTGRLHIGQVYSVIHMIEHITVRKPDGLCMTEAPPFMAVRIVTHGNNVPMSRKRTGAIGYPSRKIYRLQGEHVKGCGSVPAFSG